MQFSKLADYYQKMEKISSRIELRELLVQLFKEAKKTDTIATIARLTSGQVFFAWESNTIGMAEKSVLEAISKSYSIPKQKANKMLRKEGDVGTVVENLKKIRKTSLVSMGIIKGKPWEITDILKGLRKIGTVEGKNSVKRKNMLIGRYLNMMSQIEAKYFVRMLTGDLRIGVKAKTIIEALASFKFEETDKKTVIERAYNVLPNIEEISRITLEKGLEGLKKVSLKPGIPFRVMAAKRLDEYSELQEKLGLPFAVEWKYDGERLQIHIEDERVTMFTRRYDIATHQFPDLEKELLKVFRGKRIILEGEIVAFSKETGEFQSFQTLMRRRRQYDIQQVASELPVYLFIFDIVLSGNKSLLDHPYSTRRQELEVLVDNIDSDIIQLSHQRVIAEEEEFQVALKESIVASCEGLIAKKLSSPYKSGTRGWEWIKIKKDYVKNKGRGRIKDTFDLVVVGGFHGRGRRTGMIGSFLLASYNSNSQKLETVCKIGTGFSEEELEVISEKLDKMRITSAISNLDYVDTAFKPDVWFKPEIVLEIECADITLSPNHTCAQNDIEGEKHAGLSLRFPRFMKIREDRKIPEITTSKEILTMYLSQNDNENA